VIGSVFFNSSSNCVASSLITRSLDRDGDFEAGAELGFLDCFLGLFVR
jgi:hypothetical protein